MGSPAGLPLVGVFLCATLLRKYNRNMKRPRCPLCSGPLKRVYPPRSLLKGCDRIILACLNCQGTAWFKGETVYTPKHFIQTKDGTLTEVPDGLELPTAE